jgi:hypothetical protein
MPSAPPFSEFTKISGLALDVGVQTLYYEPIIQRLLQEYLLDHKVKTVGDVLDFFNYGIGLEFIESKQLFYELGDRIEDMYHHDMSARIPNPSRLLLSLAAEI